jgi:hypothetical protein
MNSNIMMHRNLVCYLDAGTIENHVTALTISLLHLVHLITRCSAAEHYL